MPTLEDSARETVNLLEKASENGKEFDIHPFMHEFTMDTISRIAMGQIGSKQFQNDYTKILIDTFNGGSHLINSIAWACPPLGPLCQKLGLLRSYIRQRGIAVLLMNSYKAVKERKEARVRN